MRGTVVALAVVMGLSACGSDKVDSNSVAHTAARTRAAGTARVEISLGLQGHTQRFAAGFVDTTQLLGARAADSGPLEQLRNPEGLSSRFATARHVDRLGSETVRGVHTTHYRSEFDTKQVLAALPNVLRSAAQRLTPGLSRSMPVEVWVDDQGRMRRQVVSLTVKGETAKVRTELYDFGVRHTVTPPPTGQIADGTAQAQLP
jgi:hypothetical protein